MPFVGTVWMSSDTYPLRIVVNQPADHDVKIRFVNSGSYIVDDYNAGGSANIYFPLTVGASEITFGPEDSYILGHTSTNANNCIVTYQQY